MANVKVSGIFLAVLMLVYGVCLVAEAPEVFAFANMLHLIALLVSALLVNRRLFARFESLLRYLLTICVSFAVTLIYYVITLILIVNIHESLGRGL